MEKTIKAVMERTVVSSELLNENSLLIVSEYKGKYCYQEASIVYVDHDAIHEDTIGVLSEISRIEYNENIVAVHGQSSDSSNMQLVSVYDLERHIFEEKPFIAMLYDAEKNSVKQLLKK